MAKCWPRAEEEVKPCTSICKGVTPRGGGELFRFWLEYSCPLLKSKEIREVEAEVELWKRDVAVLGSAGMLRVAETSLDTAVEPSACPAWCRAMAARAEVDSGLTLGNVAVEGSWAVVHASLGLCGV